MVSGVESAQSQSHKLLIDLCFTFCACAKPGVRTLGPAMGNQMGVSFKSGPI